MQVKWNDNPVWNDIELKTLRFMRGFETARTIHNMGKPTIAMVRGPAVGAGVGLAHCCDFRVVSENAYFLPGYIRVGISPDFGTSYFVSKIVGPAKARELYMLNEKITPEIARPRSVSRTRSCQMPTSKPQPSTSPGACPAGTSCTSLYQGGIQRR